ncbi:MAG: phospholipid carrier-dependent glycosyltransferase [Actinomycetota bacterium]|nr:phospholipid carrier-dependent glycosyltransferase [Actinomycetota bacterium]
MSVLAQERPAPTSEHRRALAIATASPRLAERLRPVLPTDRGRALVIAAGLGAIALWMRLWRLSYPPELIFDEAYYPVHANEMLELGSEYNRGYDYIVHPPLGKWLIGLGETVFGHTPVGWRVPSAIAGTLCVLLLFWIARRMTGSTFLGAIAGLLLASDGFSFVLGRTGLLDIFVPMFVLGGLAALLIDRDQVRTRLATMLEAGPLPASPRLGLRSWRMIAGILFGAACAVKWSGIWFLAAFAILSILWDRGALRAAGVPRPTRVGLRRVLPGAVGSLAVLPVVTYVASFAGWFAGESSQGRHWAEQNPDTAVDFIPNALRSLWHQHAQWLEFHNGLSTDHPWESNPWSWLVTGRPILFWNPQGITDEAGGQIVRYVLLVGTPVLWFAFIPSMVWMMWLLVSRLDWRAGVILGGIAAGWLSWFINLERTMFLFYMAPAVPFFILAITLTLGSVLGGQGDAQLRRTIGLVAVSVYLGMVILNFIWLHPILVGSPLPEVEWRLRMLFRSWF